MKIDVQYDESRTKQLQRNVILSQAYRLIIEKGLQNVTMQDIAEASSIQRRTLYYYYSNKDAVAVELINCVINEFKNHTIYLPNYFTTGYARIEYIFHYFLDYLLANEDVVLFTVQADYYYNKNYGESNPGQSFQSIYGQLENVLYEDLERGMKDGSVKEQFANNAKEVFFVIGSSIIALAQRLLHREEVIRTEAGYDRSSLKLQVELLLSGIKA